MASSADNLPDRYRGLFDAARRQLGDGDSPADDVTMPQFLQLLRESDLLPEDDWSTCRDQAESAGSAREFAGKLHERGLLTSWQCRMLLEGKSRFRIGDYELIGRLGAGGMGVVYQAKQRSLNRVVALKMIRSGEFATEQDLRRFQLEAEAVAKLDHPQIVPVYEVGAHDGQQFFSMGFVDGHSLSDELDNGPLPSRRAADLLRQIAEAIAYAHANGVIHRDLKPGNILLDRDGKPRVTDFGLAKQTEADSGVTATGQIVGTPSYMPPEQALGKAEEVGPPADIYSMGALLYCVLTGRPPFQAATVIDTLRQVITRTPVSPRALNADVDRDLETICLKCLNKEAGQRYASAKHLADDLGRYLNHEPIQARPVGAVERTWRWAKRRPALAALALTSFVALASSLAVFVFVVLNRRLNDSYLKESAARKDALAAKSAAETARGKEAIQRRRAEEANDLLQESVYNNDILMADVAFREGERERSLARLMKTAADRRGWEWRFLRNRFDSQLLTVKSSNDAVAFSPDGRWMAGGGERLSTTLWNADTGRILRRFKGPLSRVKAIQFSRDGHRLTAALQEHIVSWDPRDGRRLGLTKVPKDTLQLYAIDPDARRVVLANRGVLSGWIAGETKPYFRLADPAIGWVRDLTFGPEGRKLLAVVIGRDGKATVEVRDARTGHIVKRVPTTSWATSAAFGPDGTEIVTGTSDGRIEMWETRTLRQKWAFHGLTAPIYRVRISPDGDRIAASGAGLKQKEVKVWFNSHDGVQVLSAPLRKSSPLDVVFSAGGLKLAVCDSVQTRVWDATGRLDPHDYGGQKYTGDDVCFAPDGRRLAAIVRVRPSEDKKVAGAIWSLADPVRPVLLKGPVGVKSKIAFSPNGQLVATSGGLKTPAKIWNAVTGEMTHQLDGGKDLIRDVSFSGDGRLVAIASSERVRVYLAENGKQVFEHSQAAVQQSAARFLRSGSHLLVLEGRRKQPELTIRELDVNSGRTISATKVQPRIRLVNGMAIGPGGKRIAVFGSDGVAVIDRSDGRVIVTLRGHADNVTDIAFSPDGRRLASCGLRSVRVWDARTGQELIALPRHGESGVAFGPKGRWFAVGAKLYDGAETAEAAHRSRIAFHRRIAPAWHLENARDQRDGNGGNALVEAFHLSHAARYLPQHPQLRISAGRILARLGIREAARREFIAALKQKKHLKPEIRAHYLAEVGRYREADVEYRKLVADPDGRASAWCGYALLGLANRDARHHAAASRRFLHAYNNKGAPRDRYQAVWTATLQSVVADDRLRLSKMAERVAVADSKYGPFVAAWGAACYRAGDDRRAIPLLSAALKLRAGNNAYTRFFLAMAMHRAGKVDEAAAHFRAGLQRHADADRPGSPVPSWIRRAAMRALRREALRTLGPVAAPRGR